MEQGEKKYGSLTAKPRPIYSLFPIQDMSAINTTTKAKSITRKISQCVQCGASLNAKNDDCGKCCFCKDKKKFGGPNKLRQKCSLFTCKKCVDARQVPASSSLGQEGSNQDKTVSDNVNVVSFVNQLLTSTVGKIDGNLSILTSMVPVQGEKNVETLPKTVSILKHTSTQASRRSWQAGTAGQCCVVVGCHEINGNANGKSFFNVYRTNDAEWTNALVKAINRTSFTVKSARICSKHFTKDCLSTTRGVTVNPGSYAPKGGRFYLKKRSIPTISMGDESSQSRQKQQKIKTPTLHLDYWTAGQGHTNIVPMHKSQLEIQKKKEPLSDSPHDASAGAHKRTFSSTTKQGTSRLKAPLSLLRQNLGILDNVGFGRPTKENTAVQPKSPAISVLKPIQSQDNNSKNSLATTSPPASVIDQDITDTTNRRILELSEDEDTTNAAADVPMSHETSPTKDDHGKDPVMQISRTKNIAPPLAGQRGCHRRCTTSGHHKLCRLYRSWCSLACAIKLPGNHSSEIMFSDKGSNTSFCIAASLDHVGSVSHNIHRASKPISALTVDLVDSGESDDGLPKISAPTRPQSTPKTKSTLQSDVIFDGILSLLGPKGASPPVLPDTIGSSNPDLVNNVSANITFPNLSSILSKQSSLAISDAAKVPTATNISSVDSIGVPGCSYQPAVSSQSSVTTPVTVNSILESVGLSTTIPRVSKGCPILPGKSITEAPATPKLGKKCSPVEGYTLPGTVVYRTILPPNSTASADSVFLESLTIPAAESDDADKHVNEHESDDADEHRNEHVVHDDHSYQLTPSREETQLNSSEVDKSIFPTRNKQLKIRNKKEVNDPKWISFVIHESSSKVYGCCIKGCRSTSLTSPAFPRGFFKVDRASNPDWQNDMMDAIRQDILGKSPRICSRHFSPINVKKGKKHNGDKCIKLRVGSIPCRYLKPLKRGYRNKSVKPPEEKKIRVNCKCVIPHCSETQILVSMMKHALHYYPFPSSNTFDGACRRSAWIAKLSLERLVDDVDDGTDPAWICGLHFVSGRPSLDNTCVSEDYLPTMNITWQKLQNLHKTKLECTNLGTSGTANDTTLVQNIIAHKTMHVENTRFEKVSNSLIGSVIGSECYANNCVVSACSARARDKVGCLEYFSFPLSINIEGACQRSAWIAKLNCSHKVEAESDKPSKVHVCGRHFVKGKPSTNPLHVDYLPTQHSGYLRSGDGANLEPLRKQLDEDAKIIWTVFEKTKSMWYYSKSDHFDDVDSVIGEWVIRYGSSYYCLLCDVAVSELETHVDRDRHRDFTGNTAQGNSACITRKNGLNLHCNICKKTFHGIAQTKEHVTNVHAMLRCKQEICGKKFQGQDALNKHTVSQHGNEQCKICKRKFSGKSLLAKHMLWSHKESSSGPIPTSSRTFLMGHSLSPRTYNNIHNVSVQAIDIDESTPDEEDAYDDVESFDNENTNSSQNDTVTQFSGNSERSRWKKLKDKHRITENNGVAKFLLDFYEAHLMDRDGVCFAEGLLSADLTYSKIDDELTGKGRLVLKEVREHDYFSLVPVVNEDLPDKQPNTDKDIMNVPHQKHHNNINTKPYISLNSMMHPPTPRRKYQKYQKEEFPELVVLGGSSEDPGTDSSSWKKRFINKIEASGPSIQLANADGTLNTSLIYFMPFADIPEESSSLCDRIDQLISPNAAVLNKVKHKSPCVDIEIVDAISNIPTKEVQDVTGGSSTDCENEQADIHAGDIVEFEESDAAAAALIGVPTSELGVAALYTDGVQTSDHSTVHTLDVSLATTAARAGSLTDLGVRSMVSNDSVESMQPAVKLSTIEQYCEYFLLLDSHLQRQVLNQLDKTEHARLQDKQESPEIPEPQFIQPHERNASNENRKPNRWKCVLCPKMAVRKQTMRGHMTTHYNIQAYKCPVCNRMFSHDSSRHVHIASHKSHDGGFSCLNHVGLNPKKQESNRSKGCGRFSDIHGLNEHIKTGCRDLVQKSTRVKCALCEKICRSEHHFRTHLKNIHKMGIRCQVESCKKLFSDEKSYKEHMQACHGPNSNMFVCDIGECQAIFGSASRLTYHKARNHEKAIEIECVVPLCGFKCKGKDKMRYHKLAAHAERSFLCTICGSSFHLNSRLLAHIRNSHSAESNTQCNICGKILKNKKTASTHMENAHSGKTYPCDICQLTFSNHNNMLRHRDVIHTGTGKIPCAICGKVVSRYAMKSHTRRCQGTRMFHCRTCQKSYVDKVPLQAHMSKNHQDVLQTCLVCYNDYTQLAVHMTSAHPKPTFEKVRCHLCTRIISKHLFDKHLKMKHIQQRAIKPKVKPLQVKTKCPLCDKVFSCRNNAHRHIKQVHDGKKPYQCTICDRFFSSKNACQEHMERHKGEKSYSCDICNKSWNAKSDYTKHMKTNHANTRIDHTKKRRTVVYEPQYVVQDGVHERSLDKEASTAIDYLSDNVFIWK